MRTIKFRAISMCKDEHWVYGDICHYNRNPHTEKWTIHDSEIGLETDVDENTIGQFTNLYDKNGKEIYEGDILDVHIPCNSIGKEEHNTRVYVWNKRYARFELVDKDGHCIADTVGARYGEVYYTVIGNIHDNPELLKGD